jgi:hypothetical protein
MNYQVHIKHTDISNTGGHVVQLISLRKWQRKSSVAKYVNSNFFINTLDQIKFLVESTFYPLTLIEIYIVYHPEGIASKETSSYLCFLLCEENNCTLGHILLLLHSHTSLCGSSRSKSHKKDCHIYPSNHYNSKRTLHPKVIGFSNLNLVSFPRLLWLLYTHLYMGQIHASTSPLDTLRECHVTPSN